MSIDDLIREKTVRHKQTFIVQGGCIEYMPSINAAKHDIHVEIYPGKSPRRGKSTGTVVSEVLAKGFLIHSLMDRFRKLNPDVADVVDWSGVVPQGSTFGEGLEVMKKEYPVYAWG